MLSEIMLEHLQLVETMNILGYITKSTQDF